MKLSEYLDNGNQLWHELFVKSPHNKLRIEGVAKKIDVDVNDLKILAKIVGATRSISGHTYIVNWAINGSDVKLNNKLEEVSDDSSFKPIFLTCMNKENRDDVSDDSSLKPIHIRGVSGDIVSDDSSVKPIIPSSGLKCLDIDRDVGEHDVYNMHGLGFAGDETLSVCNQHIDKHEKLYGS